MLRNVFVVADERRDFYWLRNAPKHAKHRKALGMKALTAPNVDSAQAATGVFISGPLSTIKSPKDAILFHISKLSMEYFFCINIQR